MSSSWKNTYCKCKDFQLCDPDSQSGRCKRWLREPNKAAENLRLFRPSQVKPKKGKGSYSRKGRKL